MGYALLISLAIWPGPPAAQIPVLYVSPASLVFVVPGQEPSPAQQVRIRNIGSGSLQWKAVPSVPWIRVSPTAGTGSAIIAVVVDGVRLGPGRHDGLVTIDAGNADDSPAAITVAAEVVAGPAVAAQTPAAPVVTAPASAGSAASAASPSKAPGDPEPVSHVAPASMALRIDRQTLPPVMRNLPYSQAVPIVGGTPPYLIRLVEGRLPHGLVLANGAVAGTARTPGYYPLRLAVSDSATPPATISQTVALRVIILQMDTALVVTPPALKLAVMSGTRHAAARIGVGSGRQPLDWSITTDAPWLTAQPASGTSPGVIEISVTAASLAPGTYIGTLTVTMEGAPNSPARIPVQITVPHDKRFQDPPQ